MNEVQPLIIIISQRTSQNESTMFSKKTATTKGIISCFFKEEKKDTQQILNK